ncbi:T9SS type A sorting domain-containing protein [Taibaiella soli]|uniref:Secretion system C-terminal sorting domain-containing protein n=1 Tax=Taibaiella soli TaxID=1649169 RepID=A0A2W2APS0_9BACT|nr:T9SS type A sorting domain-containing protein [Taibaiella soli]PZF74400.1 hypothetical protein DN068_02130 [Taibaiella soli]
MKKLFFFSLIAVLCATMLAMSATAQSVNVKVNAATIDPASANDKKLVYVNNTNALSYVNLHVKDNLAFFDNLGDFNALKVHVTNADGKEVVNQTISTKYNAFDISRLAKGLYFVTLINENTDSRKAFTLNL